MRIVWRRLNQRICSSLIREIKLRLIVRSSIRRHLCWKRMGRVLSLVRRLNLQKYIMGELISRIRDRLIKVIFRSKEELLKEK